MNFPFSILILLEIFTASKPMAVGCEKKDALSFIDSCVFLGAVSFAIFLDAQEARDAATRIYRIGFFMLKVLKLPAKIRPKIGNVKIC